MTQRVERRAHVRTHPRREFLVDYPHFQPRLRNISLSGAFIEDIRPFAPGRLIRLRLVPRGAEPIVIQAMVRRVEQGGMGVEFLSMSETDNRRLRQSLTFAATAEPTGTS